MSREGVLRLGLLAAAVLLAAHALSLGFVSDDAFLSFRYARNLLEGHGLVYNPGERVEGYTDFLWTVLLAGVGALLPGADMPAIARTLGLLFGAATIVLVGLLGREVSPRRGAWLLVAPALIAADTAFAVWTTSGLESPMFSFLVVAAAWSWIRWTRCRARPEWAPLLLGLATLARPDGALLFAVTAASELAWRRERPLTIVAWAWPFLALVLPWFLWRWSYYGWPLPNSFYAKVGSPEDQWKRGARYLLGYLRAKAWFLAPLPLALLARRRPEPWAAYVAALGVAYAAFVVAVGGDGLFHYRFCAHLIPLAYLLVQEGLGAALSRAPRAVAATAAVLASLLGIGASARASIDTLWFPERVRWEQRHSEVWFPGRPGEHGYRIFEPYFVDRLRIAAEWLEANARPGAVVASTPAGAIGYYMRHPLIDMLGLNDEHIAHREVPDMGRQRAGHEKGDGRYVLSRKPEYILLGNVAVLARPLSEEDMPSKLVRRSEEEIWADPGFHRDYELVTVRLADSGLFQWFTFWRRRGVR